MTPGAPHFRRRPPRPGMTLVELMVSLALVTIIVAACGSMLMVMAKAMGNDASNVGADATVARAAADQVVDDLKAATAVTEQSATAIAVTVPDRNADGVAETWGRLLAGRSGARTIQAYDATHLPTNYACEVRRGDGSDGTFDAGRYMEPKDQRKVDDFILYGVAAAQQAVEDSGWVPGDDEARARTTAATRRFARRQDGWFRKDPRVRWIRYDDPARLETALALVRALGEGSTG